MPLIFQRFLTTSEDFRRLLKIFKNGFKGQTNVSEHFPQIAEDN